VICVRAFITSCLRSSEVENPALLVYVRAESKTLRYLTPCLRSSGVENLALLYSLFMFERSREPCLSSSLPDTTLHLVYVRAESRTCFIRQAESRTLRYFTPYLCLSIRFIKTTYHTLFMFERSREPFLLDRRSREPFLLDRRSREPPFE